MKQNELIPIGSVSLGQKQQHQNRDGHAKYEGYRQVDNLYKDRVFVYRVGRNHDKR